MGWVKGQSQEGGLPRPECRPGDPGASGTDTAGWPCPCSRQAKPPHVPILTLQVPVGPGLGLDKSLAAVGSSRLLEPGSPTSQQEVLGQETELCFMKGLPCTHANKRALKMVSKRVRVGTQIPQLKVILFIFLKRETNNIIFKGFFPLG